jgi:hypothetical protein
VSSETSDVILERKPRVGGRALHSEPAATDVCRHQHPLWFISTLMSSRGVTQGPNHHYGAESGAFAVFNAAQYPRIATSTIDKTTDRDNH